MTTARVFSFLTATALVGPVLLQGQAAKAPFTLDKAATAAEISNDQRTALVPAAGQTFLWISATGSGPRTVDLTKVAVTSGASKAPLIAVDSAFAGDPKQFSMIAPVKAKDGTMSDPLEETRSIGIIGFAFEPGKTAQLKIIGPQASFCLLFSVPQAFRTGQVTGLGARPLAVPALTAAK